MQPKAPFAKCRVCPLKDQPLVPSEMPPVKPLLAVVGEGPGYQEVREGRPFVGPSGRLLRPIIRAAGWDDSQVLYTNAILCQPTGTDKDYEVSEARLCCHERLMHELGSVKKVLAVGRHAMASFGKVGGITETRGKRFESGGLEVMPTYHPAYVLRQESGSITRGVGDPNLYLDLKTDIFRFADKKLSAPPAPKYHVISCADEAASILEAMRANALWQIECEEKPYVALDLESETFKPSSRLIVVGISNEPGFVYLIEGEAFKSALVTKAFYDLAEVAVLVGHNYKFDRKHILAAWGCVPDFHLDTLSMDYALDERRGRHSLKDIVMREWELDYDYAQGLHDTFKSIQEAHYQAAYQAKYDFEIAAGTRPRAAKSLAKVAGEAARNLTHYGHLPVDGDGGLYAYAARDVDYTLRLAPILSERCGKTQWAVLDDILLPTQNMLTEVESAGFVFDTAYQAELHTQFTTEVEDLTRQAREITDNPKFNPGSSKQVAEFLTKKGVVLPRTKSGKNLSTDKKALQRVERATQNPLIPILRDIRAISKLDSTYVVGKALVVDDDGRLRPNIHLAAGESGEGGTIGLRPSFSNPNFGNLPRGNTSRHAKLIKRLYKPSKNCSIIQCDYSAAELRLLAWLAKEDYLIDIFRSGVSPHKITCANLFGIPVGEVDKDSREYSIAKTTNFGYWYALGEMNAVAENLEKEGIWIERKRLDEIGRSYGELMPKLVKFLSDTREEIRRTGRVVDIWGAVRRFGYWVDDEYVIRERTKRGVNHKGQSGAVGLTWRAMCELRKTLPQYGARMLLTVYDSIILEAPIHQAKDVARLVSHTMSQVALEKLGDLVPFTTDASVGPSWGKLEEIKL